MAKYAPRLRGLAPAATLLSPGYSATEGIVGVAASLLGAARPLPPVPGSAAPAAADGGAGAAAQQNGTAAAEPAVPSQPESNAHEAFVLLPHIGCYYELLNLQTGAVCGCAQAYLWRAAHYAAALRLHVQAASPCQTCRLHEAKVWEHYEPLLCNPMVRSTVTVRLLEGMLSCHAACSAHANLPPEPRRACCATGWEMCCGALDFMARRPRCDNPHTAWHHCRVPTSLSWDYRQTPPETLNFPFCCWPCSLQFAVAGRAGQALHIAGENISEAQLVSAVQQAAAEALPAGCMDLQVSERGAAWWFHGGEGLPADEQGCMALTGSHTAPSIVCMLQAAAAVLHGPIGAAFLCWYDAPAGLGRS